MIDTSYSNAYKEVLVVIDNLVKQDYEKIPKEYIEFFNENSNSEYEFRYDVLKSLEEQNLLDYTKYILFGLFEKFGATEKQKAQIQLFKSNCNNNLEEQALKQYNPNDIFKSKQDVFSVQKREEQEEKTKMIEYKEQKWYQKLFAKLLKVFKKN